MRAHVMTVIIAWLLVGMIAIALIGVGCQCIPKLGRTRSCILGAQDRETKNKFVHVKPDLSAFHWRSPLCMMISLLICAVGSPLAYKLLCHGKSTADGAVVRSAC
jgi:hypothetical protein